MPYPKPTLFQFIQELDIKVNWIVFSKTEYLTILIQKEFYGPEFDSLGNKVGKNHPNPTSARFIISRLVDI